MNTTTEYITDNFSLNNKTAQTLYHKVVVDLPIIDYHNHLNAVELSSDQQYKDVAVLWVANDPYKHRAMRINGIPEESITGDAPNKMKFLSWCKTVPYTLGNPLYIWSHLEMKRVFGYNGLINEGTAEDLWEICNAQLKESRLSPVGIMKNWKVEALWTSDDWSDDLENHAMASKKANFAVNPSLRADKIFDFGRPGYIGHINELASKSGRQVNNLDDFEDMLLHIMACFKEKGSKLSDHALDAGFHYDLPTKKHACSFFRTVLKGQRLSAIETVQLKSYLLFFLGKQYYRLGWTMQLHIGAQRSTSSRLRKIAGASGGYAGIGTTCYIQSLCMFLDSLEKKNLLPDVILYTLNPADNEAFATLTGSFSENGKASKVQFGPPWWYNDHRYGIENYLEVVSSYSLLAQCIGMTTDSRSILSFSRHEYFRRVLCNYLGKSVENGVFPNDEKLIKEIATRICYTNSKNKLLT